MSRHWRGQRFASSPGSETEKALNGSNFLEPLSMTNARLREGRLRDLGNIIARLQGSKTLGSLTMNRDKVLQAKSNDRQWRLFSQQRPTIPMADKRSIAKSVQKALGLAYED